MQTEGRFGRVINSLPFFGSNGGVVAQSEAVRSLLWQSYAEMLEKPGLASATVIGSPLSKFSANVPCDLTDTRTGQVTYLDLVGDPELALMDKLDSTARRNVRKSQKSGVQVRIDNSALSMLAAIHCENMMAIGGRVKPKVFFELFPKHMTPGSDWNLYVATYQGVIVACLLLLYSGTTVDYYIPGTRLDDRNIQPSAALLFQAMLDAHSRGCRVWNWGGTWLSQEGVLRFKRKWGAVDQAYEYYIKVKNAALLDLDSQTLLDVYGYFYTVPFSKLRTA
jgi:CelD/BcsL family acetyltransferase involved in cellulose biosynthesis